MDIPVPGISDVGRSTHFADIIALKPWATFMAGSEWVHVKVADQRLFAHGVRPLRGV
jgi:hypothetical protein